MTILLPVLKVVER